MGKTNSEPVYKFAALVTYAFALLCLIAGLFLPFTIPFKADEIPVLQLPAAFGALANATVSFGKPFTHSFVINLIGTGFKIDIMAWVVCIYVVITVLGLIALIPIIVSKNYTKTARVLTYIIEVSAAVVLSLYALIGLTRFGNEETALCVNLLIVLAGVLLALIVQSCIYKKSSGAAKLFLFLLSAIATLALFDFTKIIPALRGAVTSAANAVAAAPALFGKSGTSVAAIDIVAEILADGFKKMPLTFVFALIAGAVVLFNYFADLIALSTDYKRGMHTFNIVRYALALVASVALLITVLATGYTYGVMLVVLMAATLIQTLIGVSRLCLCVKRNKKAKAGEGESVQTDELTSLWDGESEQSAESTESAEAVKAAQQTEEQARAEAVTAEQIAADSPAQASAPYQPETASRPVGGAAYNPYNAGQYPPAPPADYYGNTPYAYNGQYNPQQSYYPPYAQQASYPQQPTVIFEQPVRETRYYTVNTVYHGPMDEFIRKLTNEEKIEFSKIFIEKTVATNLGNLPEYVIGGDNRRFFSTIFIYLGRIRSFISDGLLNKMYRELNTY